MVKIKTYTVHRIYITRQTFLVYKLVEGYMRGEFNETAILEQHRLEARNTCRQ